jgi:hypothetical protein
MNPYIKELKRLWANYVKGFKTRDVSNWQYYVPVMAIMPVLLLALLWQPGYESTLIHLFGIFYVIGLITTPFSAWNDIRTKKRSVIEAKTMLLLFVIGWPLAAIAIIAFEVALSYPIQGIFGWYGLFYRLLGNVGSIIGPILLFALIPIIWRLLGAVKSTGFAEGVGQAMHEIAEQADNRERIDIYDKNGKKIATLKKERR